VTTVSPELGNQPDRQPGKRERNKAEKRRRILEAARQLFDERGFDATTTAEIARVAGVGAGTLYLYVESKEQLLFDVFTEDVDGAWAAALETVDAGEPLADQVFGLLASVTQFDESQPNIAKTYHLELSSVIARSDDGISATMDRIFGTIERVMIGALDGEVPDGLDTAAAARNIFAIWNFNMGYHYCHPDVPIEATLAAIRDAVDAALFGVG
jgi:AcrR family transcriptional regulator